MDALGRLYQSVWENEGGEFMQALEKEFLGELDNLLQLVRREDPDLDPVDAVYHVRDMAFETSAFWHRVFIASDELLNDLRKAKED